MTERDIFIAAIQMDEPDRQAYLVDACAGQPELRRQVENLLRLHEEAGSFLDKPAADSAATGAFQNEVEQTASPDAANAMIGPYKLLEQIGEGGMGTVWMAQQTEPVKRLVALKLIKAGMDSKAVIARFEAERQALALMDHVNIARVLDAGTTDAGRPYFVMDLVKGLPITQYCDQQHLPPRQRLELFIPVCQAVQHAHQKGIIHRDLKPSNVLVALYDGKPVPKVIDFGVAKATGQTLTEKTLVTGFGAIVGTLEYMSPEQAEVNQLDIDTRSDIYSLGVLLYELLAGSTPFSRKDLEKAGMLEMLRVIREQEPSRPSMKLSSSDALPTLSANRGTEPAKLTKLVRGELDWIVMKALEKERSRRYETANGFAMDVQRYLADEPVQACPPSMGYRLRKFARRNKGTVVAAALVLLALILGITGTTLGMIRARVAEGQASQEAGEKAVALGEKETALGAAKANETKAKAAQKDAQENLKEAVAAVDQMLLRVGSERLAHVPQMESIRRELLQDAVKFYKRFLEKNGDDPMIRRETAMAYRRLADLYRHFGEYAESEAMYLRGFSLFEQMAAEAPLESSIRFDLVSAYLEFAHCFSQRGKHKASHQHIRRATEIAEDLVKESPTNPSFTTALVNASNTLAWISPPDEAERILRRNLTLAQDPWPLASVQSELAKILVEQKRQAEAEQAQSQAVALWGKMATENPKANWAQFFHGTTLSRLGVMVAASGRLEEAVKIQGRAIEILDKVANDFPGYYDYRGGQCWAHHDYAGVLKKADRTADAEKSLRRVVALFEKLANDFPGLAHNRQVAFDQRLGLGKFLIDNGRAHEALQVYSVAMEQEPIRLADLPGQLGHWKGLVRTHIELGRLLVKSGKKEQADTAFRKAAEVQEKLEKDFADKPDLQADLARSHHQVANLLRDAKQSRDAEHFYGYAITHYRTLAITFPEVGDYLAGLAYTHNDLGWLLFRTDKSRLAQAEKEHRNALGHLDELVDRFPSVVHYHAGRVEVLQTVATRLQELGDLAAARPLRERSITLAKELIELAPKKLLHRQRLRRNYVNLANLLVKLGEPVAAEKRLRQSLATFTDELLANSESWLQEWQDLILTHIELGGMLTKAGKPDEALAEYRSALANRDKLEQKFADKVEYSRHLAQSHLDISYAIKHQMQKGGIPKGIRGSDEIGACYRMAMGHAQKWVVAEPGARESRTLLAHIQLRLAARLLWRGGHAVECEEGARKALAAYDQLGAEFPEVYDFAQASSECLEVLATLELHRQDYVKTENLSRQAVVRSEKLLKWPHPLSAPEVAVAEYRHGLNCMHLSDALQHLDRSKEAAETFALAIPLLDKATQYPGLAYLRYVVADCHGKFGSLLIRSGRMDEAQQQFRRALELRDSAGRRNSLAWSLAAHPDPKVQRGGAGLAVEFAKKAVELAPKNWAYVNTLGAACYRAGDWKAAVAALDKSMELRKGGDSFDWFFVAMAHWQLGEKDKARSWYERAVEWMDKNQPMNAELRRFRAEASELLELKVK